MDPWEGRGAAWVSQGWWLGRSWGLEDVITLWTTKKYKAGEVKDVRVWFFFFFLWECWYRRALAHQIRHC